MANNERDQDSVLKAILSQNFSQRLVSTLLLLTLHAAIVTKLESPIAHSLILAHIGLFLIWQPIWRGDQRLNWQNTLVFVILMGGFIIWLDWWLLTGWLILLIGLTGGRLPQSSQERNINLIILFFLFIELLIGCASHLFTIRLDPLLISLFNSGLFLLPFLILVLPVGNQPVKATELQVDLFGAITTALLASLLLLGSIINSHPITDQDYVTALVRTFLFIGILVFLISWLLSPKTGFSGLTELWTQSLLNIGTPFEHWISDIASLKNDTDSPEDFIDQAAYKLLSLPMIDGVRWDTSEGGGQHGKENRNQVNIDSSNINVVIMSRHRVGATLLLHFKLLVRVIDHFYTAKMQERELARRAHMQAIHETGARITHDIKNILQSFHNITSVVSSNSSRKSEVTYELLRNQLPILTERLELALNKLQSSETYTATYTLASDWWQELKIRHCHTDIIFNEDIPKDREIPCELFDTVIDNLIENARQKQESNSEIVITVNLSIRHDHFVLSVTDSGNKVPDEISANLFKTPLTSSNGFGVGLLQSAEMAEYMGYEITLTENVNGNVCFSLTSKEDQSSGS